METLYRNLISYCILVTCILGALPSKAQTTLSTTPLFLNNNGTGLVTFNFQNTNASPVIVTGIEGLTGTAGAMTVEFWYKPTPVNGAPGIISAGNGWTQVATAPITGIANTTTTVTQVFFSGLSFSVPGNTTYAFAVHAPGQRYYTMVSPYIPLTTVSGGGCNLLMGTNISYGGGTPNTVAPPNTPRGWIGKVTFIPSAPCTNPPTPGTTTSTANTICPNTNFTLSLTGGTSGTGQTYQWQSSPNGSTWTNIGGATNNALTTTQIATTYYRCQVTCGTTVASNGIQITTNSSPLSGTYTLNAALPASSTNYQSFTTLALDLACAGVSGPVIVNVANSTYTEQVDIPTIPGSSSTNTVTINGNSSTLTYSAATTAAHTLMLSGADYMIFNNLTVVGTGATYALACHLWNQSDNNTFNNCTFTVPANCTNTTQVPFSLSGSATAATTSGVSGNNNVVNGCTMNSGYYNTCMVGNSSPVSTGNQVINCNLLDYYFYGSYNLYQNGIVIRGNTIERPTRTTLSTFYGIYVSTGCVGMLAERNRIRNPFGAATTNAGTTYGIYCLVDGTVGNENRFYNNLIYNINSAGPIYSIYATGADYIKLYHNTISLDDAASTATGVAYGIYSTGTVGGMDFKNNVINITRGGTGTKSCLYFSTLLPLCNNNDLYINSPAGTNYIGYYTVSALGYSPLASWQSSNGAIWDQQSVSVAPVFQSPGTGDYTPTAANLNNTGANVGVTTDILGAARNVLAPDMGCYEFSLFALDAGAYLLYSPAIGNGCYSPTQQITIQIKNYGSVPLNFSTNPATITCNITGPANSTLTGTPTGTLSPGAVMNVLLSGTANMGPLGTYTINASMTTTGDPNATNDAMVAETRTKVPLVNGTILAAPATLCVTGNPVITLSGASGANIQWQQSTVGISGPWTNVGTNSATYAPSNVTQTTYYQASLSCYAPAVTSNVDTVTVNSPAITSSTGDTICGNGTLTLSATATAGATVNWFSAPTGGSPITTGNTYVTPVLSSTTTYYAAGVTGSGGTATVPMPGAGTPYTGNVRGLWFTAPTSFTITGLQDMGVGAGMQSITVVKFTGNTPPPSYATVTNAFTVLYLTQNNPNLGVIPVNIPINAGEVIGIMGQRSNVCSYATPAGPYTTTIAGISTTLTRLGMQYPLNTTAPIDLWQEPTGALGRVEITYQVGCESPRVAVTALVNAGPAFSVTSNQLVCNNTVTALGVTSNVNDFNQYTWSPTTNLYTNAGATIPYTGGILSNGIVYHKTTTSGPQSYICTAYNTSSFCSGIDTVVINTQPSSIGLTGDSICVSGTTTFDITGTTVGIQWQNYPGAVWTNIPGATGTSYTTPVLTTNTPYRVRIMNGLGVDCYQTPITAIVNNPSVISTVPGTRCGTGSVVLGATANAGSNLYWYNTPTPTGPALGTGPSFTTPSISSTTNYYVLASAGSSQTPGNLYTTNVAGNGAYGNLFDVQAVTTIRVDSFSIYAPAPNISFSIYYRVGTGVGFNTSNVGWTLIGSGTIGAINAVPANLTVIPLNVNLILTAGQTYSFAISTGATVQYTNGTAVGNLYVQDPNLKIFEGYGGSTTNPGFGFANSPRVFNGRIYYTSDLACSSPTTMVTATVTNPPTLTISGTSATICAGSPTSTINITSTLGNYNTYSWSPSLGVSGNPLSGYTFNPTVSTTYVLTGIQTSGALCQDTAGVAVTALPVPITPTITPPSSTICNGSIQSLVASGSNNNVTAATGSGVLTTSATGITPYSSFYEGSREQYLILASELTTMGFVAGNLNSIAFNVTAQGPGPYSQLGFTIKMAHTANTSLAGYGTPTGAFSTVYGPTTQGVPALGLNTYTFATPFSWDGTSNVLVDICHDNDPTNTCAACYSTNSTVTYTATAFNSVYGTYNDNAAACGVVALNATTTPTTRPNMTFTQSIVGNYTWSPTGGLYTDPLATIPYTGTIAATVYAKPTTTTPFTVTATGVNGCTSASNTTVTVNPVAVGNAGNGQTVCYGTNPVLSASASGGANAGTWSGAGAGSFSNASSPTSTFIPNISQSGSTVTLTWTTNTTGVCPAAVDTVNITVNAPGTASVGPNASICVSGVQILTAVSTPGTGTWTSPNGTGGFGNANSANTIYTPGAGDVAASPILLIWTTSAPAAPCVGAKDTLALTVNANPSAPTPVTSTPATICVGDIANLTATSIGSSITWYTAASGGSSIGTSASGANFAVTPATTTTYYAESNTGACSSTSRTPVTVTVNPALIAPNPVTATFSTICPGGSTNLNATSAGNTIQWYTVASGGTNIGTSGSGVNFGVTPASTTTYYAESASGACVSTTRTAITITVDPVPAAPAPVVANAATICLGGSSNLTATSSGNTIQWYTVASGGSNIGTSASGANFVVSPAVTSTYYAEVITGIGCLSASRTPVTVTVDPVAVANAGNGQTICYGSTVSLGASSSGGANAGTWTGGLGGYSSNSNPSATYTPALAESGTTVTLTWTTNATGACPSANDTVRVTINQPATTTAGVDITTCGLLPINLSAVNGGAATSGIWSGTYAGSFSGLSNPSSTYTPNMSEIGSTLTLTWTTNDPDGAGPCSAAMDNVNVAIGNYSTTLAPPVASASPWIADYENTDVFGWTHYYDDAGTPNNYCDDYLILSIQNTNTGGNAVGHIGDPGFVVKVGGQGAYSLNNGTTPYVSMGVNWYLMGRYWEVTPVAQPVNDVNVKFYFTNADFNAVNALSPYVTSSPTQMAFYKINNGVGGTPSYNPDPSLLHAGVPVASPFAYNGTGYWQYFNGVASTSTWAYSSIGTDHVAEYIVDRFSGGGGGGGTGNAGAFPVELLSFTGYNNGNENVLEWTTSREINNKEFILMHSMDNIAFEEIATLPTQAPNGMSSSPISYTTTDMDFANKTYYRLKQIDLDGTSRMYPATVEVNINNDLNTVVSLFPNPAKDLLNISITQPQGGKHKIEIYDAIGKLVSVHKQDLKGGNTIIPIDVSELSQGTYIVMIKNADNGTVANTRFVKE